MDTRTKKVDSGGTSNFKRVGAGVTDSVVSDGSSTYKPGISERRSSTTTYLSSGLKTLDQRTNSSQTDSGTRRYDAFGAVVSSSGSWASPWGYAGKFGYQEDPDGGYQLLGHRYYDASTGRFLTRDPVKDGRNWYSYCENSPVGREDNAGLSWHPLLGGRLINNSEEDIYCWGEPGPGCLDLIKIRIPSGGASPSSFDVDYFRDPFDSHDPYKKIWGGPVRVTDGQPGSGWLISPARDFQPPDRQSVLECDDVRDGAVDLLQINPIAAIYQECVCVLEFVYSQVASSPTKEQPLSWGAYPVRYE